ncbi:hypothetical protein Dxin01_03344 [Deinococcus xinjiangensis]|uniref:PRTRC system protein E n=1 Tax=Deinococcus xinjiangensis TaxID=457454 RepID=A0ABP9VH28_9DEIO
MSDTQTKPLSDLLKTFAPEERYCVLRDWEDGLATVLRAIPRPDQPTFDLALVNPQGKTEKRKVPEELVILSDAATKWLEAKRLESRLLIIETTGKFDTIPTDIEQQSDLLNKLAEARRKFILNQRKAKQPGEAATPTTPKSSAKKTKNQSKTPAATPAKEQAQTSTPPNTDEQFGNLDILDKLGEQEQPGA